nr:phosphoglucan phosphatase (LSF) chloroplastic [Polytomella parva]|eukprot:CAMPEP_0175044544 /NCGR_PEP_ID=MMETSP0052_2-20121109/3878_1 /TAXON_ID=51329 ORGANISM="Polytomella parva, Strain SAG 63-3" /NCGR_SAMPLE_ID=MMETSP0052_2 /ASSEMBLY_ACC=CAM_ASM_000194 /LENGTH=188 /DNA_ID=CAMNT_0016307879 /DNA_START=246 /DNA_END=812 /DNA_ORIENTATION=+
MPNLICGSQPRNRDDVKQMREEIRVDTIINLQQDKDLAYWNVSLKDIESECGVQSINFIRKPAQDFDPHSLRKVIPGAAASLHQALRRGERVYVHCTAGLGRSPALCIAYMFWSAPSRPLSSLNESYDALTRQRPCGPNRDAIRGATFDLLDLRRDPGVFETLPKDAYATLDEKDRRRIWDILLTEQK